jgi:hypothetical protein
MWSQDFKEFVGLLNLHEVAYLIVGGYALGIHGYPRYTGDLDVWINPTPENGSKMVKVMEDFGFASMELTEQDFAESGNVIQMGYLPFRIDVLTRPDDVTFEECYPNRLLVEYEGVKMAVIGLEDFKKNKQASGRPKDLMDLGSLM